MTKRRGYQESFDRAKSKESLQGRPKPEVQSPPRHDADDPGPHYFKAELIKADLSGLTLPGLFAGRSDFRGVTFAGSDLHLSNLCWNEFLLCDFEGAVLSKSDLRASNFRKCRFKDADLAGCDLRHATFEECDFTGAGFKGATLTRGQQKKLPLSDEQKSQIDWVELGGAFPEGG